MIGEKEIDMAIECVQKPCKCVKDGVNHSFTECTLDYGDAIQKHIRKKMYRVGSDRLLCN